ncbi:MAG: hypothetical protein NZ889_00685 [Candidatus Pacearchaeota archaeon]|nr:hypothetical protein [Candidatus Pacearchaeota archaeon]
MKKKNFDYFINHNTGYFYLFFGEIEKIFEKIKKSEIKDFSMKTKEKIRKLYGRNAEINICFSEKYEHLLLFVCELNCREGWKLTNLFLPWNNIKSWRPNENNLQLEDKLEYSGKFENNEDFWKSVLESYFKILGNATQP